MHYFEDGNLQLQTSKSIPQEIIKCSPLSDAELVGQVVLFIQVGVCFSCYMIVEGIVIDACLMPPSQSEETSLQNSLDDMYTNMNQETFRSMRRLMPITRTKMEWNVNSVRMVKQVRK